MGMIRFENNSLPVYLRNESISLREAHSEMAHWHDTIELLAVRRGTIRCKTVDSEFVLHKGDICLINRRQLHHIMQEGSEESSHDVLIVGMSLLMQNSILFESYIGPMLTDDRFTHVRFAGSESPAGEILNLMNSIIRAEKSRLPGYEFEVIAAVYQILRQLYLAYSHRTASQSPDNNVRLLQQMVEFIYENYMRQITLDEIAYAGNVSRSQCARLFRRYTDMSPITFLNHHRLETSLHFLRNTTDSIAHIAQSCGFSDQSYYNRLFRRNYGCTPLAYRRDSS